MFALRPAFRFSLRVALTLALALMAALLCLRWQTPLPWMIGPLLATAFASMLGVSTLSWNPLRDAGQWVIGAALGLYFTPQVVGIISGLWWAIVLAVLWALALGYGFGRWLHHVHAQRMPGLDRATTFFSGAIGGAPEMTLLAEREMARTDLVASAHSLRVLVVTVTVPFAMQFSGWHGLDTVPPLVRDVSFFGLLVLALFTGLGALAMQMLKRANPWFMGALLVSMGLTMNEVSLSGIPPWLSNTAQLFIGVSLGVRFTAAFVQTAPRWLASVAIGTLAMIGLCACFGGLLGWATNTPLATMILGVAPGGIAEMAITAKVLQLGVAVVTAFQVCRLVTVLVLVEPLYKWLYLRDVQR
ncbi:AbrB family transcriptional regulator [Limnohabitans sp.]|uniref:AbrB family transcriptional regulator n=1 Tax=Limnohabitans sp. TaxID=1907725 RepID=UPI00286EC256|nr:AbrB family transcriptional regulator [Limnohabitans sp.]